MNSPFKVSVFYGSGTPDSDLRLVLSNLDGVKLVWEARDLEIFLAQYRETPPDLVLVDLDEITLITDWLESLLARLPRSQVVVCSKSRDPDFLIPLMEMRPGGFLPLPLNPDELLRHLGRLAKDREKPSPSGGSRIMAVTATKGGGGSHRGSHQSGGRHGRHPPGRSHPHGSGPALPARRPILRPEKPVQYQRPGR